MMFEAPASTNSFNRRLSDGEKKLPIEMFTTMGVAGFCRFRPRMKSRPAKKEARVARPSRSLTVTDTIVAFLATPEIRPPTVPAKTGRNQQSHNVSFSTMCMRSRAIQASRMNVPATCVPWLTLSMQCLCGGTSSSSGTLPLSFASSTGL
jgi:hypothetical protein